MPWYFYLLEFLSGALLANGVPHFVQGVCGNRFPTPFAKPPGRGLSSPMVNVVWALANLVVGTILFRVGRLTTWDTSTVVVFFVGLAALSLMCSSNFAHKHAV